MGLIRPGIRRLFHLGVRRPDIVDRDVEAEVALHLELRIEQLRLAGLSPAEARHEAERRFGRLDTAQAGLERTAHRRERRMGFREWMEATGQDVRYALRGLRREPAFTAFAVATLALGIGANAAMYGIVDRLLLRGPEHLRAPERLVRFTATVERSSFGEATFGTFGYVLYGNLRAATHTFDGVAAYKVDATTIGEGRDARPIRGGFATADFFPVLGVRAAKGRFFQADEDDPAGPASVVVLGDGLWRTQFGADPAIVGRTIRINDAPATVIGVAPRGFTGVELGRVDAWMPMSVYSQSVTANWTRSWNAQWLYVVGRVKAGVSRDAASEDATAAHRATYDGSSPRMARARIAAVPIRFSEQGKETTEVAVSRWLLGVTIVVLLIACTNVANLLLARAIRRRGEVGVRLALGAARARLARLFLTESLVLAVIGGALALLVAAVIATLVRQSLLTNVEWPSSPVSGRVLAVSAFLSVLVGMVVGLAPAAHAARGSLMNAIQRGHPSGRRLGLGAWPTVLQACLTVALLVGAGLFTRSLQRARTLPLGFEADRVVVGQAQFPALGDRDPAAQAAARARRAETWRRVLDLVHGMPGVERAALAVGSPFGNSFAVPLTVPGWDSIPRLTGGGPYISAVSADYFSTVGTRVQRGRSFVPADGPGTEPVAVVNQTMARTLWPGRDAIGQCLRIGADTAPCSRVVGIVEDARRYELREDPAMQYYIPLGQERGFGGTVLLARPRGSVRAILPALASAIEGIDASVVRATAEPMQDSVDPLLRPWRLGATIFGLGGVLALLVAALGLYSVMSYAVTQRSHEMGVRIALGASARNIITLVMRQSLTMATAGLVGGLLFSLYAGRFVRDLLFDTSPRDPVVMGTAAMVLLLTAAVASLLPALRAGGVDPMRSLRSD